MKIDLVKLNDDINEAIEDYVQRQLIEIRRGYHGSEVIALDVELAIRGVLEDTRILDALYTCMFAAIVNERKEEKQVEQKPAVVAKPTPKKKRNSKPRKKAVYLKG